MTKLNNLLTDLKLEASNLESENDNLKQENKKLKSRVYWLLVLISLGLVCWLASD